MKFIDITTDKQTLYTLAANEKIVFFMLNRSDTITFDLTGENAEAHIFAFFKGKNSDKTTLNLIQKHLAPNTVSHALIKSALYDKATFSYNGLIRIEQDAPLSDASQECRTLILSPEATSSAKPALEILTDDVRCRHAATTSSPDAEQLFFMESRGLSKTQAIELLAFGFFKDALEKIQALGINTESINAKIS